VNLKLFAFPYLTVSLFWHFVILNYSISLGLWRRKLKSKEAIRFREGGDGTISMFRNDDRVAQLASLDAFHDKVRKALTREA
jgi:hypothetical protein